jgi:hypothetical protein
MYNNTNKFNKLVFTGSFNNSSLAGELILLSSFIDTSFLDFELALLSLLATPDTV